MNTSTPEIDLKKSAAAQNAREGLITVADLSLLTGIAVPMLTKFAKTGLLNHYGEYHGKRFYNFAEVVRWATEAEPDNVAKETIRKGMEVQIQCDDCPYDIEKVVDAVGDTVGMKIVWTETAAQPQLAA